jgi:hypothetical protein
MCGGVLWAKRRNVYSASAAAFKGLREFQSGSINAGKGIMRARDDVAVECGDFIWISNSVKDPSTRDKSKIAQKPQEISVPLFSCLRPLYRGHYSRQTPPHLLWKVLDRLILAVPKGILLVKDSRSKQVVIESVEGLWRK